LNTWHCLVAGSNLKLASKFDCEGFGIQTRVDFLFIYMETQDYCRLVNIFTNNKKIIFYNVF
jgi:hypothetical protein